MKKKPNFGTYFTAGNDTIGVRIPNHKIVSSILNEIDFPIIAPSANISGEPSGVEATDIIKDFDGKVDAIILTGGMAYDEYFIKTLKEYISFIGKVVIIPGEEEMQALSNGVLRVLNGEEKAQEYTGVPVK